MRHLKTILTVLGAVTVLVLAGNTIVLAATGSALIAGQSNSANNITSLTRTTNGSALKLQTKSSVSAPLTVNGKGKVTNLNADKVDGLDSTLLHNRSYVFYGKQFVDQTAVEFALTLPSGAYNVSYSIFTNGVSETGIQCYIIEDGASNDRTVAYSSMVHNLNGGWDPSFTGSGLVIKKSTTKISLFCNANSGTFDSGGTETPIQIVASPTNIVSTKIVNNTGGVIFKQQAR